jgi:hypothetical protein
VKVLLNLRQHERREPLSFFYEFTFGDIVRETLFTDCVIVRTGIGFTSHRRASNVFCPFLSARGRKAILRSRRFWLRLRWGRTWLML